MQFTKHGFPRRNDITQQTPAERAIREAVLRVEEAGCHPLLTDAVVLLQQAKDKVADWVELSAVAAAERPAAADAGREGRG